MRLRQEVARSDQICLLKNFLDRIQDGRYKYGTAIVPLIHVLDDTSEFSQPLSCPEVLADLTDIIRLPNLILDRWIIVKPSLKGCRPLSFKVAI